MIAVPAVRAVLFDLDDTLFDHRGCARAALGAVHAGHPAVASLPFEQIEQWHGAILEELHHDVMLGRVPIDSSRVQRFQRLYAAAGVDADRSMAEAAAALYRRQYIAARRAIAGAALLLRRVKERAAIGIVSNNLLDEQRDKLRHCGLAQYVDALVVSEEVGISKPDPHIFHLALERLGCDAAAAVMVGDSWSSDVVGARSAGIRVIWFNPHRQPSPDPAAGVVELHALEPAEHAMRLIFDADRR